jgi:hypothetical protein
MTQDAPGAQAALAAALAYAEQLGPVFPCHPWPDKSRRGARLPSIDAHTVLLVLSPGDDPPDPLRYVAFDRGRIPGCGADYCDAGDCHSKGRR